MLVGKSNGIQFWFCLCVLFVLCGSTSAQTKKVTYDEHVLPVLRDKCLNCHNADKAKGGLDASNYGKLMEGGSSGAVVKAGDADGSRLYRLASHNDEPKMPPNSPAIAKASLDLFKAWIESGALENAGSKAIVIEKKADIVKVVTRGRPANPPMPSLALPQEPIVRSQRANAVTALTVSPWSPLIAVAAPKSILLYHSDTLELVGVLPFAHGQVNVLRFSRSGELLLAAGGHAGKSGKVVLYDVKSGKIVTELADETDAVTAADINANQTLVAVGGPSRTVRIYSVADGQKLRDIKKHTDWITGIEFSPDGVLLATADRNGGLQVWEAETGRDYFGLAGHKSAITDLSWRDDSNLLASASEDGTVKLWEMEEGKNTKSFPANSGTQGVKFAHDGRLVTTGRDLKAKLFDPNGGVQREFGGLADLGLKVAVTHDNGRVLAGDWTGSVHVWNASDGKEVGRISTNPPTIAERLKIAQEMIDAKQKAFDAAKAANDATTNALKAAADAQSKTKAEQDRAAAELAAAKAAAQRLNQVPK